MGRQDRHFYFRLFLLSRKASNAINKLPKDINNANTPIKTEMISNAVIYATSFPMYFRLTDSISSGGYHPVMGTFHIHIVSFVILQCNKFIYLLPLSTYSTQFVLWIKILSYPFAPLANSNLLLHSHFQNTCPIKSLHEHKHQIKYSTKYRSNQKHFKCSKPYRCNNRQKTKNNICFMHQF